MSDTVNEQPKALKESNDDRKRQRLHREAVRAHEWRVRVWAECELRIRQANVSTEVLGGEPYVPWDPNFDDDAQLLHYSTMQVSK